MVLDVDTNLIKGNSVSITLTKTYFHLNIFWINFSKNSFVVKKPMNNLFCKFLNLKRKTFL